MMRTTTTLADEVVADLGDYFSENLIVENRAEVSMIHTPFLLPDGSCITIGVSNVGDGEIQLSDLATVSSFFFTEGRSLENEAALRTSARVIASRFGAHIDEPEIKLSTVPGRAGMDTLTFAQALMSVAGLYDRRQRRARPDFTTRVKTNLAAKLPRDLPFTPDHTVTVPLSGDGSGHTVEYGVDAAVLHARPRFLQAVGGASSAWRVATVYHALQRHEVDFAGAIIYDDESSRWTEHYRAILEDTPARLVVPAAREDEVVEWLSAEDAS
ncbi:MAG: hypothetical protein ACOC7J_07375 [Armatimonadota bacterium]